MSRTESFLAYVEQHPEEMLGAIDDKTDALVREHETRLREASRHHRTFRPGARTASTLADAPF